jgi:UDP-glucose 4-epimerase
MRLLITGGAGYIGTHICVELLNQGHKIFVIDNLSNSSYESLDKAATLCEKKISISGKINFSSVSNSTNILFFNIDIRDRSALRLIFKNHSIDAVIHLAGYKDVGKSVKNPLDYYNNNVSGSIVLFEEMARAKVKTLIFSSSATVYGDPESLPIEENFQTSEAINPYGKSKLYIENILKDLFKASPDWKISLLRYFNPVGAHPSGVIGEDPKGVPNNLMPYISQVAAGKLEVLKIYGDSYPTVDGTGVRDYIHVVDLAKGHIATLDYLVKSKPTICIFNLGTGKGTSVLEMVYAFEEVVGKSIPYVITERREGDVAECWTSSQLAKKILDWTPKYNLKKMCQDAWRWQLNND